MEDYKKLLALHGFVEHAQVNPDSKKSHFAKHDDWASYFHRQTKKQDDFTLFEYVLLISYQGKFCEAVYEAYIGLKNTYPGKGKDEKKEGEKYSKFQKSGQSMVDCGIYRNLKDFEEKIK